MAAYILEQSFNPWESISEHQKSTTLDNQFGATATFIGTMRDFNDNVAVSAMILEHYPAMTQYYLEKLIDEATCKWNLLDILIIHRVGNIKPSDPIMLIACWSAHRRASLDACSWLIEELKHRAPFWKKETRANGEYWVEKNTNGL
jgi:molybdopterin synthase catalytic subunit|tara:strand:- start:1156 stop:1593 length:438 start_codon:yes stop_codon:yes gene_type:complete